MSRVLRALVLACVLSLVSIGTGAFAQSATGSIAGIVTDSSGRALAGAEVSRVGASGRAATGRDGSFRLADLPAGQVQLIVRFIGYAPVTREVTVTAGTTTSTRIALSAVSYKLEELRVEGQLLGQAAALSQQRTADNLVNVVDAELVGRLPDQNIAEALARVPGVAITRDQGEGRFVLIRGTPDNLNAVQVNGVRVASPEQTVRRVPLDVIPTGQVAAIEVSKTLTPDMDADAVGGSINLVTRAARSSKPTVDGTIGAGWNDLNGNGIANVIGNVGQRFGKDQRLGVVAGGTYYRNGRGSEGIEPNWCFQSPGSCRGVAPGQEVDVPTEFDLRSYPQVNRRRAGGNINLDYRLGEGSEVYLRANYNNFEDDEVRYRNRIRFSSGTFVPDAASALTGTATGARIERQIRRRKVTQEIGGIQAGGAHRAGRLQVDYTAALSFAEENRPDVQTVTWRQSGVGLRYDVTNSDRPQYTVTTGNEVNTALFNYTAATRQERLTREFNYTGRINFALPVRVGSGTGFLRFGGSARLQTRRLVDNVRELGAFTSNGASIDGIALPNNLNLGFFGQQTVLPTFGGAYTIGSVPDPNAVANLFALWGNRFAVNQNASTLASAGNTYEAGEDVYAGYAMATLDFGALRVIPGARIEATRNTSVGNLVANAGSTVSVTPTTGSGSYARVFPGITVRYELDERTNIRIAGTTAIARPNYVDLVPFRRINAGDPVVLLGNPALRPSTSYNADILFERYFSSVGVISAGAFYKRLNNFIFPTTVPVPAGSTEFGPDAQFLTQPRNGDAADLYGFEVAVQQKLTFLPGAFSGLGVNANYTFTDSRATIPLRGGIRTRLPGQIRHTGNVGVFFDRGPVSLRTGLFLAGRYLDAIGIDEQNDRFYDRRLQLDVSGSLALTPQTKFFAEFTNLTNQALKYSFGPTQRRTNQFEVYSFWGLVGFRYGL